MPPELDAVIRKAIGEYSDRCSFPCPEDHDALEVDGATQVTSMRPLSVATKSRAAA